MSLPVYVRMCVRVLVDEYYNTKGKFFKQPPPLIHSVRHSDRCIFWSAIVYGAGGFTREDVQPIKDEILST